MGRKSTRFTPEVILDLVQNPGVWREIKPHFDLESSAQVYTSRVNNAHIGTLLDAGANHMGHFKARYAPVGDEGAPFRLLVRFNPDKPDEVKPVPQWRKDGYV